MSIENVREFEERVRGDEALQARLRELSDAFDGDGQDARAVFDAVVAPLAAEAGLPHTYDEALEYAAQRNDDEDITPDEAKAVTGGVGYLGCFTIGFGDVDANACSGGEESGANACAFIGVGFLSS